jgi:regulator of CtrA degradation
MSEGPQLPHANADSAVHPPITFLDRTYDEALALTHAARGCIAAGLAAPLNGAPLTSAFAASIESMRLTARITQIMAWCLAQKAIFAGELERDAAIVEKFALGARTLCLGGTESATDEWLSKPLRNLLAQSHALYVRVMRLDELMHREVVGHA